MENLKEMLVDIENKFNEFKENSSKQVDKGNKTAGQRARKNSLELRELLKKFKALSIEA